MMKWWRRNFYGFRIGGLTLFRLLYSPSGRRFTIASYHNRKRMCWLWFLEVTARRGIMPRVSYLPGAQAKTYIDLPFCRFFFCWQDQGRYTDPSDERVRNLVGVRDWNQLR